MGGPPLGGSFMRRMAIISDAAERAADLAGRLEEFFDTEILALDRLPPVPPGQLTLVDIDLRDPAKVPALKAWLKLKPADGRAIFAVGGDTHAESVQAFAIGATDAVRRPVDARLLAWRLSGGISSIANKSDNAEDGPGKCIAAGVNALQQMFAAAVSGATPNLQTVTAASAEVVASLEEEGLSRWLDVVRKHHSQTYQHSLVVTAVAVSFGRHLGFSQTDKNRIAAAGLLHDIGKARIPIEILEKPAPLTDEEAAVLRQHPTHGFEVLRDAPGLQPDMLDIVLHHHEYLDGSGYPHNLQAKEISDLVRVMTIADIYGALIERRSYKPPYSGAVAYEILQGMNAKLDKDFVRAFGPFAQGVA
jgi:putative nucleotidyltransferase with HDIG domain